MCQSHTGHMTRLNVVLTLSSQSFTSHHFTTRLLVGSDISGQHICPICNERGLSGKYPAILNISRTGRETLMELGSQSEETLLCICEQSLSCGPSQSAVRRRWLSLCAVWPSHSQWPSEQIRFITKLRLPILQLSCRIFFWQSITSPRSVSPLPPPHRRFGSLLLLSFPKAKIVFEREEICEWMSSRPRAAKITFFHYI